MTTRVQSFFSQPTLARASVLMALFLMLGCASSIAERPPQTGVIFLGELRSVTLTRPDRSGLRPDGRIIISNSCGDEIATFRVVRSTEQINPRQTLSFRIGEWCDPPIHFSGRNWLIVRNPSVRQGAIAYEVDRSGQTVFALPSDNEEAARTLPESIRQLLVLQPLPEPIEYIVDINDREWISRRTYLEIRDGKVWITQGILLDRLFPGLTARDLDQARLPR